MSEKFIYYIGAVDSDTFELVNDELDNRFYQFYYDPSNNQLNLYKSFIRDTENVLSIVLNSKDEKNKKELTESDFVGLTENKFNEMIKGAKDIVVYTEKTRPYYIKNFRNCCYSTKYSPRLSILNRTSYKIELERDEDLVKFKIFTKCTNCDRREYESSDELRILSLDTRNGSEKCYYSNSDNIIANADIGFFERINFPKEILEKFLELVMENKEKIYSKTFKTPKCDMSTILDFNRNEELPEIIKIMPNIINFYCPKNGTDRETQLKELAEALNLPYNDKFEKIIEMDSYNIVFLKLLEIAGFKDMENAYNIFNTPKEYSKSFLNKEQLEFTKKQIRFNYFAAFKDFIETLLKYRTEEEIVRGLSRANSLTSNIFYNCLALDKLNAFDGKIFDRLAYVRFSAHAEAITKMLFKEITQKRIEEMIASSTQEIEEKSIKYFVIENIEDIKDLVRLTYLPPCSSTLYADEEVDNFQKEYEKNVLQYGLILSKDNKYSVVWGQGNSFCCRNVYLDILKATNYYDIKNVVDKVKKDLSIKYPEKALPDDDFPFL